MKKIVMMALCAFVQTAGLTLVPQQAMAAATPLADGTKLWDGRATFRTQNGEMWIEGQDLGDPTSSHPAPFSFTIKLVPLKIEHVDVLCKDYNNYINNKKKNKKIDKEYLKYLGGTLGNTFNVDDRESNDFSFVKWIVNNKKNIGYAIINRGTGTILGFIYDSPGGNDAKAYVSPTAGGNGAASQAYITYIKGFNTTYQAGIALGNIPSLNSLASAINRGALHCKLRSCSNTVDTTYSEQQAGNPNWRSLSAGDIRDLAQKMKTGMSSILRPTAATVLGTVNNQHINNLIKMENKTPINYRTEMYITIQ